MSEADDLLKRLVEWSDDDDGPGALDVLVYNARTYLAREKGPVAEACVSFYRYSDGSGWYFVSENAPEEQEPDTALVRIPVPRHLYAPEVIEGEVVEGDDAK